MLSVFFKAQIDLILVKKRDQRAAIKMLNCDHGQ